MDLVISILALCLIAFTLGAWLALFIGSRKTAYHSFGRAVLAAVLILIISQPIFNLLRIVMPYTTASMLGTVVATWIAFTFSQRPDYPGLESTKARAIAAVPPTILFMPIAGGILALAKFGISKLPG